MTTATAMTTGELAAWAATHPAPHAGESVRVRREGRELGAPPCCLEFFAACVREPFFFAADVDAYWWLVDVRPDDGRRYVPCPGCLGLPLDTALDPTLIDAGDRAATRATELWPPDPAPGPARPETGPPMTTATALSGTWSVDAFFRAHLGRDHLAHERHEHCVRCWPALTARGVLPLGWPAAAACRLIRRMLDVQGWRDTPHWRDRFITDAQGRLVYGDGFDDIRAWVEDDLGREEQEWDPPGSFKFLAECDTLWDPITEQSVDMRDPLTDRLGPERMAAFVKKVREEGPDPDHEWGWTAGRPYMRWQQIEHHFDIAARLGRYAGLKWENAALLEQAHRDEAVADAAQARLQAWDG
jgi:hypothetical protein